MSAKTLYRASGLALVLGAVLFPSNGPQTSMAEQVLALLGALGNALFVIGLPGIAARQASRAGWLGFVGFVVLLLGVLDFVFTLETSNSLRPAPRPRSHRWGSHR